MSENVSHLIRFLKIIERCLTKAASHILILQTKISSKPCALLLLRDCNIFIMFSSVKVLKD